MPATTGRWGRKGECPPAGAALIDLVRYFAPALSVLWATRYCQLGRCDFCAATPAWPVAQAALPARPRRSVSHHGRQGSALQCGQVFMPRCASRRRTYNRSSCAGAALAIAGSLQQICRQVIHLRRRQTVHPTPELDRRQMFEIRALGQDLHLRGT